MRKHRWIFALLALAFASLACQTLLGGGEGGDMPISQPAPVSPEELPAEATSAPETDSQPPASPFPLPQGVTGYMDMGEAGVNFQTSLSLTEAIAFYRESFAAKGYTEREINTTITEAVFSLVFDGDPSGKATVVQGVDLGNGTVNISLRLEDL
jgi:hypothetical protein